MPDASVLPAIRAHFGLRQADLVPWLALSRDQIANVENGREALPRHARSWLRPWAEALAQAAAEAAALPAEASTPALPSTGPAPVLARLAECYYQAQRLGQQLAALHAAQRVAAARLAAGPLLLAALPLVSPTPETTALALRRRWLARLLAAATDALAPEAPAGPLAAALLAARRRGLLHEAASLRAWLAGEALL
ncbi:hypothetical protein [Hymenobacter sp. IS2118]|uniref:hypothetical protein n=1 Tax=Hymenobacter sp. IS2118 TaxID=1505605 RepID=UPI00054E446A|nr:hypothetical protein [Hymenobacter sp. IS2118]